LKTLLWPLAIFPLLALGAGEHELDPARIDRTDAISIQRGARVFVNYCLNCHAAASMRYNRLTELGLSEQQIKDNLLFASDKVGDAMTIAARPKDAKQWFGVAPPDLSVISRSRGADWLYTYLRGFYRDPARATGWNNTVFPNVAMPHALWQLQGIQRLEGPAGEAGSHETEHSKLVLETPGTLSPREYDALVRDLVNYLVYMGEPAQTLRVRVGIVVLFALAVLWVLAWLLKREYWKDVHGANDRRPLP
jgi:ubiquinol-cytochrome c reductase cytochrome c1 subunit